MATPFLLSRVIEAEGQDIEITSIKDKVAKDGPFIHMVVFSIG